MEDECRHPAEGLEERQQRFTVVLPHHQHEQLAEKKRPTDVSIADHIRLALNDYLNNDTGGDSDG